jgi:hypothetical protein
MSSDNIRTIAIILCTIGIVGFATTNLFLTFAEEYPIISSFLKFFVLASLGDVIGMRLKTKTWQLPLNFFFKAIVWGIIGIVIYLVFQIYPYGIYLLQIDGILPFFGSELGKAFLTSFFMNITFAPAMMSIHRISENYLDQRIKSPGTSFQDVVNITDWGAFYHFILLRTIPFFWIPAHTITFLLPTEYRILFAAILGIVLGLLLSLGEQSKKLKN